MEFFRYTDNRVLGFVSLTVNDYGEIRVYSKDKREKRGSIIFNSTLRNFDELCL